MHMSRFAEERVLWMSPGWMRKGKRQDGGVEQRGRGKRKNREQMSNGAMPIWVKCQSNGESDLACQGPGSLKKQSKEKTR